MKYFNTLCIITSLLLLSSCGNEEKAPGKSNSDMWGTYLTATINGEEFSSSVRIMTYNANKQTYLTTSDNDDHTEYAFNLIIKNNDPKIERYGFIERVNESGENITWKLPNNFDFTSSVVKKDGTTYLEGTFSFTANAFSKGVRDSNNQLVVTNGKFKAFKGNR